jgi:hypothetical protein
LKLDPSVFVEPERDDVMAAEAAEADNQNAKLLCNYNFSWKPKFHVDAIEWETKRAPDGSLEPNGHASEKTAMVFFYHIINFVAQLHGNTTRGQKYLQPSAYLNVKISQQQLKFLNLTPGDVLMGNIFQDSIDQNVKKILQRGTLT